MTRKQMALTAFIGLSTLGAIEMVGWWGLFPLLFFFFEIEQNIREPDGESEDKTHRKPFVNYRIYIKGSQWKRKSQRWRDETEYCQNCRSIMSLVCHHLHYRTLGYEQREDIAVLCQPCHQKLHDNAKKIKHTEDYPLLLLDLKAFMFRRRPYKKQERQD